MTITATDKKLGLKWVHPYKIKEVLRYRGAYRLQNTFTRTTVQRAVNKVKQYVGDEGLLVCPKEAFSPHTLGESDPEEEHRPVGERRPVRRYEENGILGSPGPERERGPERQHGEEGDEQQMTADQGPRNRELAGEASDRLQEVTSGEEV